MNKHAGFNQGCFGTGVEREPIGPCGSHHETRYTDHFRVAHRPDAGPAVERLCAPGSEGVRACGWLVAQGLPAGLAKTILWVVKLAVLGVLLYSAFWLTLPLAFVILAAWVVRNADADESSDDDEPQWRNGLDGYGLYRGEVRIDGGSADDE